MTILLSLIISFTTISNPEPELGYWVCDAIRQEKNIDFVILPYSIFIDSISYKIDTIIITYVSVKELNQIVSKNLSLPNLIPISGFAVIIDSLGNLKTIPNKIKEKYSLITTKSLNGLQKVTILNERISEILISYLQKGNYITFPQINRYLFSGYNSKSPQSTPNIVESPKTNKININNATLEELETLPGIGPKTAQKIIDYRIANGAFKSIKEILNVSGIGPKKFEQIKNLITI